MSIRIRMLQVYTELLFCVCIDRRRTSPPPFVLQMKVKRKDLADEVNIDPQELDRICVDIVVSKSIV